ncbi:hypothetical protein BJAS_P1650 [Bathymodiolus japonicus methanotrophic gill symbiont]|uniref:hypothetical protein n=1 Tax=Bathymodiolus japonicus methanotrophic gill symbiont TaxID=113269 RepID=UPI001B55C805|nr:hypothetical protein [Bathymodiolus japonicus methanotrophic gill symbiont]GFO71864.1 hypothetical protein BJAS_P1650 [Bathymodiolus japonicus methanotrophic gill symbiont]
MAFAEQQYDSNASQATEVTQTSTTATEQEVDPDLSQSAENITETEMDDTSSTDKYMLSEVIIRPFAVLGSVTGFALFLAASPFSGLASIPEPHDAFKKTWDNFVVTPYFFAFRRPLGDYSVELNH